MEVVECQMFRYMLSKNPMILKYVMAAYYDEDGTPRENVLHHRKLYTARVLGSRMSGEMWTSLCNGFSNLMNVLYLAERENQEIDGFVEGDDGIFGMYEPFLTSEMFRELGFNIKMQYGDDLSHTSFCGNVFDPRSLTLVVSPEQISRLFWSCSIQYIHAKTSKLIKLLRAKAMSLYITGKYTPICGPLAHQVMKIIGKGDYIVDPNQQWYENYLGISSKNLKFEKVEIPLCNRELYETKYGITIGEQLALEKFISSCTSINQLQLPFEYGKSNFESVY
jgi:hypothetical protein